MYRCICLETQHLPVHWLSKEARRRIIQLMLSTRSVKQLAKELGISTTAVRKYLNGVTHPSDETMIKVFEALAPYEKDRVYRIMIDDLTEALNHLAEIINDSTLRKYIYVKVKEVIEKLEKRR